MRQRIKNIGVPHRWQVTGIEPEAEWRRIIIECAICGEVRKCGQTVEYMTDVAKGCWRRRGLPWKRGDLIRIDGRLDQFEQLMPGGMALTWNAGGHHHLEPVTALEAY